MTKTISNCDDIIDSRDIIERIEELEADDERDEADSDELTTLQEFAKEGEDYAEDWAHGATLIRDSYFETYAEELATDCCEMPSDNSWPMYCIDWEWAARDLQIDYTQIEFDGVTYWVR